MTNPKDEESYGRFDPAEYSTSAPKKYNGHAHALPDARFQHYLAEAVPNGPPEK
jgi:hypothetical protein